MTPLSFPASKHLHPPVPSAHTRHFTPSLTDCSEICRTRRAAATAHRRCRFGASVGHLSQKIPQSCQRENTAANSPVLCSPSCSASLSELHTDSRFRGRSWSHMSVAQGTEVLYMRLGGYRRYRVVVGLQKLFINSQFDTARWVPVVSAQ
jgi:hypothetical protein